MDIVGTGFLARHLRPLAGRHPAAVVLAAGVPLPVNPPSAYRRETDLVDRTLAECRRSGRTLVFFSTAGAGMYGAPGCAGREDEPVTPADDYGRHKLALEERIRRSGVAHLCLRLSYVVGAGGRDDRLIPALIRQLRTGEITVYRGARRDVLDVGDLVRIVDGLLGRGVTGEVVNVGSGECVPVEAIIDHLEARLGLRARRRYVTADPPHRVSIAKLRRLLPEVADLGFGPDYHRVVVDRYLAAAPA